MNHLIFTVLLQMTDIRDSVAAISSAVADPSHDLLQLWADKGIRSLLDSYHRHVGLDTGSDFSKLLSWLHSECHPKLIEERTIDRLTHVPFAQLCPGLQSDLRAWCQSLTTFLQTNQRRMECSEFPLLDRLKEVLARLAPLLQ